MPTAKKTNHPVKRKSLWMMKTMILNPKYPRENGDQQSLEPVKSLQLLPRRPPNPPNPPNPPKILKIPRKKCGRNRIGLKWDRRSSGIGTQNCIQREIYRAKDPTATSGSRVPIPTPPTLNGKQSVQRRKKCTQRTRSTTPCLK